MSDLVKCRLVDDDILVVELSGNLDGNTYSHFDAEVQHHLDDGCQRIIIDCTSLGLISSVGVGSLIALKTRLKRRGGDVKLAAVQGMASDVLRVVQLDRVLSIYPDLAFARKAFADERPSAEPPA